MEDFQWGSERGRESERVQGISSKWQVENRNGEVKNCIGNGEAKELTGVTHEDELRRGNAGGLGGQGGVGIKGEKLGKL